MTEAYYNSLAPYYKLIYADWEASVQRQASALDGIIREFFGENVHHILDAACGIGTQSIGLAQVGHTVIASDISSAAIEHARTEASTRGLSIEFRLADMRQLWQVHQRQFDVVIACDNAVPHLLSDDDILQAFEQFYQCTVPKWWLYPFCAGLRKHRARRQPTPSAHDTRSCRWPNRHL